MANPWAHSRTENEFDTVEPRTERLNAYAVPGSGSDESLHDGWIDVPGLGYAPTLRISPVGEPDATRLYNGQYITTHPVDGEERTAEFWDERDAEKKSRESVVDTDSTGFQETKQVEGFPFAKSGADRWQRNPRESPPPEPRPTTGMSPHTYRFWRPFGTLDEKGNTPHRFTGLHFSMADHRRNYTILGTTPARHPGASTRNTYRLPPTPWDQNIVDLPPTNIATGYSNEEYTDIAVQSPSRSYRLT
jgi:hypothetical protein